MSAHDKAEFLKQVLKEGEEYAGIVFGKDGQPDHHLILLPGQKEDVTWPVAKDWAASIGGELPTRREQSLLFANLKEKFDQRWYWSCEQHESNDAWAWVQYFNDGYQGCSPKYDEFRARAVRRLIIE